MGVLVELEGVIRSWEVKPAFLSGVGAHSFQHKNAHNARKTGLKQPLCDYLWIRKWQVNFAQWTIQFWTQLQ